MQFKDGTNVYSADGEKVGEVNRVVVDPGDGVVTHIIVRKGFLFTEDRVVPIDMIDRADGDEVHLNVDGELLFEMPEFIETNFIPIGDGEPGIQEGTGSPVSEVYWYPMMGTSPMMWGAGYWGVTPPAAGYYYPYRITTDKNIPEGTVALEEGVKVIGKDGEQIGDVSKIFTDPDENQITHLVVTKGLLNQDKKLIPAGWISRVKEDAVQLKVDSKFVERLKKFQED